MLPSYVTKWLFENAFKLPNVVGFSNDLSIAQISGKFQKSIDDVVRFYVVKKVDPNKLLPRQLVPEYLTLRHYLKRFTFETDVIELGELKANPPIPLQEPTSEVDKTQNFRPVELGVSVGNQSITAGSLGMLYEVLEDNDYYGVKVGDVLAGDNAHVLTPDPMWTVEEVVNSTLVNILQRGNYHGGVVPDDVVGKYLWHKQISGLGPDSECPVSNTATWTLNRLSGLLGRQSRFKTIVQVLNTIDFGLYKPLIDHILKVADDSVDTKNRFGAHLFAGSDVSGVLVHISEILNQCPIKIRPLNNNYGDFQVGDSVKGCSFWCNYQTGVIDVNAVLNIGYGNSVAPFQKCVVVTNDGTIKGGWSGSGWFKA